MNYFNQFGIANIYLYRWILSLRNLEYDKISGYMYIISDIYTKKIKLKKEKIYSYLSGLRLKFILTKSFYKNTSHLYQFFLNFSINKNSYISLFSSFQESFRMSKIQNSILTFVHTCFWNRFFHTFSSALPFLVKEHLPRLHLVSSFTRW